MKLFSFDFDILKMLNIQYKIISCNEPNKVNSRKVSGRGYRNAVSDTLDYLYRIQTANNPHIPFTQMLTWQRKMERIQISNFGCRFNSSSFRVRAPLQIIIGHLKQDNFFPIYSNEIVKFLLTIKEVDSDLFNWALKILLEDAAFQLNDVNELRHNQAVACKGLLKEMLFKVNQTSGEEFQELVALLRSIPQHHSKVGKLIGELIVDTQNAGMFGLRVAIDQVFNKDRII